MAARSGSGTGLAVSESRIHRARKVRVMGGVMFDLIRAALARDPAARGWGGALEVLLTYPGVHAVATHRVAHALWKMGVPLLPGLLSQSSRFFTGVEIHPGAVIGRGFFIDHGMGVVIGETTVIGDNVTIYQGVTLGGTGKERGKRHPTLDDHVVVGVGATVLGDITVGKGSKVGGGAVVIANVPPSCTVVGVPGRVVVREGMRVEAVDLHHEDLPDPVVEMFVMLQRRVDSLEARISQDEASMAEYHGRDPAGAMMTSPDEE